MGFKILVNIPEVNIFLLLICLISLSNSNFLFDFVVKDLMPKKIKYAAPRYFTISKTNAYFASIIDNPNAAQIMWEMESVETHKADKIPAFLP